MLPPRPGINQIPSTRCLPKLLGTDRLLGLSEEAGARFLLSSTSEVYEDPECHRKRKDIGCVNCTGPRACYDEGKRSAEAQTFDLAKMGRAQIRVARISIHMDLTCVRITDA